MNLVLLEGVLSRPSTLRVLPSGSRLCSLEVTTRDPSGVAATVPVAWFDPPSDPEWDAGTELVVFGVVRRRYFRAGAVTQSRTEVVAELVASAADRRAMSKVRSRLRRLVAPDTA